MNNSNFSLSTPNSPPASTTTTTTTTSSYSGASTPKSTASQSPKCSLTPRGVTPRQYPPQNNNNYMNNNHNPLSQSSPLPLPPPPLLPTPSTPLSPFHFQSKSAMPINPLSNSTNSIVSAGYAVNNYENGLMTPSSSSSSLSPSASPSSMSFYQQMSPSTPLSQSLSASSGAQSRSKSQNPSSTAKKSKLFSSLSFGHSSSVHHHHRDSSTSSNIPSYSPSKGSISAPTTPSLLTPSTSRSQIPQSNNTPILNNGNKLTKSTSSSSSSSSSSSNSSIKPYKVHKKIKYRLKMTELSGGEKRFVFDLEGRDPDFCLWVKKTNKKDVIQDRLFVLTQYRVYSIKRSKLGKKHVQRQGHLYDLVEIKTDDIDHVLLRFSTFTIDISGNNTGIIIPKILINAFHRISFTFSLEASPSLIIIPVERQAPEIENIDPGFAHGFVEVYKAQCNYYNTPFVLELVQFLEETVLQGNREFCLDDFAGIDKTAEGAINMVPVMAALRHNTYFDTFVCHNKTRKEIPQLLADVFHHNRTLTRVSLRGIDTDEGWVQLGDALKENTSNELRYLDISDNPVRDRGITSIANAIRALTREFCQLSASNIDLQSKGAAVMFRSLQANYASAGGIETLDLSNNHLGATGSDPLQDFFTLLNSSNPNPEKPMRHLNLENTQIDTARVTSAIRQANIQNLQFLNLSENKFSNEAVQGICLLINKGQNLIDIQLRGCCLLGEQVSLLIQACTSGPAVEKRSLDLSNNNLGKNGALTFAPTIKSCTNISSLTLSLNNLRKRGMTYIISALEENTTLSAIDLSSNLKSGSKADSVIDHLARVVQRHPKLEKLVIAGRDSRGFFLGRELLPLVKSMNEESHLVELDINGNAMGDDLCRELFESLKKNSSLRTLNFDNNGIGLAGLAALRRCFSVNRTLSDIPVPTRDIAKILSSAKDRKATNDKIAEVLNDVQWALANNKNGIPYADIPSSIAKAPTATSTSTPNFRATTYISNPSSPMINNNRSADDIGRYSAGGAPASQHYGLSHSSPAPAQKLYNPPPPPPLYEPPQHDAYPPPPPPTDDYYDQNQAYDNHDNNHDNHYDQTNNTSYDSHTDQNQYDQSQYDQSQYDQSQHYDQSQQYDQSQYDQTQHYDQSNNYDQSQYDQSQHHDTSYNEYETAQY